MGCAPVRTKDKTLRSNQKISPKKQQSIADLSILPGTFIQMSNKEFSQVYSVGRSLGTGSFGEVKFCTHIQTSSRRAVKIFNKDALLTEVSKKRFEKEINILKVLDHPSIVRVFEFFEDSLNYYIVMEHCRGGELFDEIMKMKRYSEEECSQIMRQLLSCISYLHSKNIAHRDLKPENILFDEKSDFMNLKLIDFGSAEHFNARPMKEGIGTAYYMAPEVIQRSYSEKCDLWSAGVILHLLITGVPPFRGETTKDVMKAVSRGIYNKEIIENSDASAEVKDLISHLLVPEKERLTADEAMNHVWISSHNFSKIDDKKLLKILDNFLVFNSTTVLKNAVHTFIATQIMTVDETRHAKEAFKILDKDGDGKLSKEELVIAFQQLFSHDESVKKVDIVMSKVDTDNNGYIEYSEFLKAAVDKETILCKKNLKIAFEMFDKDGSGKISADELREVLGKEQLIQESEWFDMIMQLDVNGDGEIDLEEFEDFLVKES